MMNLKQTGVVILLLDLFLLSISQISIANHLGVRGAVYSIVEPDMLMGIHQKLESMREKGTLEQENNVVLNRTIQHILRPAPASGVSDLPKDATPSMHYFNPSTVLNKDIKNANGDVIAKKGTKINPLDDINFNERLVFINGDNPHQINWALQVIQKNRHHHSVIKIILVNGNIKDTSRALKTHVYFDQYGRLCQHFKIIHTPTLLYEPEKEKGPTKRLIVKEIKID